MAISFEAIGQKMVTFAAGTGLAEGKVCKISANGTVGPCSVSTSRSCTESSIPSFMKTSASIRNCAKSRHILPA